MNLPSEVILKAMVGQFLAGAVSYFVTVSLVFLVVWHWGRERFRPRRIPAPARFGREQVIREIGHTLVTLLAGMASAGTVIGLKTVGVASLSDTPASPLTILAWLVGGIVFNDAWFYACHRLLHHPVLFRHVHAVHHRSIDVNPFTSYAFHGVEAILLGIWIVPAALCLPIPMQALAIIQVVGLANNVMSHLGYEFLPMWLLKVPVLRWTNTATFHSLHHSRPRGNFGLHSRLWDRVFGTEIPEYEHLFLERGTRTEPLAASMQR